MYSISFTILFTPNPSPNGTLLFFKIRVAALRTAYTIIRYDMHKTTQICPVRYITSRLFSYIDNRK